MIYLDHNATTPIDDRVLDSMMPFLANFYGNPSSLYRAGRAVRSAIETAREQVAALVGAQSSQVIFTSGGTEANNLAIKGVTYSVPPGRMAVSAIEHPSVLETAYSLRQKGWRVETIEVDANGLISKPALEKILSDKVILASVMLANNETGVIQNLAELAELCSVAGVILHTDAVQAAGKIPLEFHRLKIGMMSLSSHKLYGPKGAGALVMDQRIALDALIEGGGQEKGLRSGTENVAAIVGFGKAAELAKLELEARSKRLLELRCRLEAGLEEIPGLKIFGKEAKRLPNTVQFGVPGTDGEMLLMRLDQKGFAISSGSACASGAGEPSHVLKAMGVDDALAKSAIRVSLGKNNSEDEIDRFIRTLKSLIS